MRLSRESREYVRLEYARVASDIASKHRDEYQRVQQLAPRGGGREAALDREQYQALCEMVEAYVSLHLEAFRIENLVPTDGDIGEISAQLEQMVRAAQQSPFHTSLPSSHEKYRDIVPRAQLRLRSAMQRMQVEARQEVSPREQAVTIAKPAPARLYVEDVDSFELVRRVNPAAVADLLHDGFLDVSEDFIQTAFEEILQVPMHKKDWGGETNDLYTSNVVVDGARVDTAFLLKGNGLRKRFMEISDCGKNGDQILRLTDSPASLFVVQFVGNVAENVIRDLSGKVAHLNIHRANTRYCVIDGQDTARLLRAYDKV